MRCNIMKISCWKKLNIVNIVILWEQISGRNKSENWLLLWIERLKSTKLWESFMWGFMIYLSCKCSCWSLYSFYGSMKTLIRLSTASCYLLAISTLNKFSLPSRTISSITVLVLSSKFIQVWQTTDTSSKESTKTHTICPTSTPLVFM